MEWVKRMNGTLDNECPACRKNEPSAIVKVNGVPMRMLCEPCDSKLSDSEKERVYFNEKFAQYATWSMLQRFESTHA